MKIAILTSNGLRHHYFVNMVAAEHEVVGVVTAVKRDLVLESKGDEPTVMAEHLRARGEVEQRYFAEHPAARCDNVMKVGVGEANLPAVYEFLQGLDPEVVLLFGTNIIRPPILTHFEGRLINMHLGLSPYYRGAATNFWPLVNNQPECVGATIHHAILKVDAGAILNQVRPDMAVEDQAHDLGCKAIIAGTRGFLRVLSAGGPIPPGATQPKGEGLLFRRRDFSAEAVRRMLENFRNKMIPAYLEKKSERDAQYPLVELAD